MEIARPVTMDLPPPIEAIGVDAGRSMYLEWQEALAAGAPDAAEYVGIVHLRVAGTVGGKIAYRPQTKLCPMSVALKDIEVITGCPYDAPQFAGFKERLLEIGEGTTKLPLVILMELLGAGLMTFGPDELAKYNAAHGGVVN